MILQRQHANSIAILWNSLKHKVHTHTQIKQSVETKTHELSAFQTSVQIVFMFKSTAYVWIREEKQLIIQQ